MTSFCEIPSHICPIDPGDGSLNDDKKGKEMEKCSRLISLDDEGTRCRAWAATQDNKTIDNIKEEYCLHNPNSPDCRCINEVVILYMTKQRKIIHFQMVVGINHVQHRYIENFRYTFR